MFFAQAFPKVRLRKVEREAKKINEGTYFAGIEDLREILVIQPERLSDERVGTAQSLVLAPECDFDENDSVLGDARTNMLCVLHAPSLSFLEGLCKDLF